MGAVIDVQVLPCSHDDMEGTEHGKLHMAKALQQLNPSTPTVKCLGVRMPQQQDYSAKSVFPSVTSYIRHWVMT